jgi:hypothetical protein
MSFKIKAVTVAGAVLALSAALPSAQALANTSAVPRAGASTAQGAEYGINLNEACAEQYSAPIGAVLTASHAWGWKCAHWRNGDIWSGVELSDIDPAAWCKRHHPDAPHAAPRDMNDPYSWRCYY